MPQATKELQDEWQTDDRAIEFLKAAGYRLRIPSYTWSIPEGHESSAREVRAIMYLIQEWDFGGIE